MPLAVTKPLLCGEVSDQVVAFGSCLGTVRGAWASRLVVTQTTRMNGRVLVRGMKILRPRRNLCANDCRPIGGDLEGPFVLHSEPRMPSVLRKHTPKMLQWANARRA